MKTYTITPEARRLLDFIASKEAPAGYDTVYGNHAMSPPLTAMTFDQVVEDGVRRTNEYGSSACGRYQFMRNTLDKASTAADIKGEMGLTGSEPFSPALQDQMGMHLLVRRGWDKFAAGQLSVVSFALKLAQEWASFPVLKAVNGKKRGQSYYAGDGQNKALVSADEVEKFLSDIAPKAFNSATAPQEVPVPTPTTSIIPSGSWAEDVLPEFEVKAIQARLIALGYHIVGLVDGKWGTSTRAAITKLQETARALDPAVVVDGHYGPQTKALLANPTNAAIVADQRANVTAKDLAKIGTPGVIAGKHVQWSSLVGLGGTVLSVLMLAFQNYQPGTANLPWGVQAALNFAPPWVAMLAPALVSVYNAAVAKGLIGASVERVREGIDNSGLPPLGQAAGTLPWPFNLIKG